MIKFVNAKINIGLNILRKREDGYHELETVFYPVGLYNGTPENPEPFDDILEMHLPEFAREDVFIFSGREINCPEKDNLVVKAVNLFNDCLKTSDMAISHVNVHLHKILPFGAGLGGGSADASFVLSTLNELYGHPFDEARLIEMARRLGADCPFFIINSPVVASGIGEIMKPLDLNLKGWWALIVKPDIYISTKEAFSGISPSFIHKDFGEMLSHPVEDWQLLGVTNDFERHLFKAYPHLDRIKGELIQTGASYASMSGSGSSIYGLYKSRESAQRASSFFTDETFLCRL